MKSISVKLSVIYIFLAILNISIFTILIFENQLDLIIENTKYKTREMANIIYAQLSMVIQEINISGEEQSGEDVINKIVAKFKPTVKEFMLYEESGEVFYRSLEELLMSEEHQKGAVQAFTTNEFMGQFYFSRIDEETRVIYFYIPVNTNVEGVDEFIFLFKLKMEAVDKQLNILYRIVILMIVLIAFFHVIFGIILHRTLIRPVKDLARTSFEISKGNFATRVMVKRIDEIGELGNIFNVMADSVEKTIFALNRKNEIMRKELQMAARVQESIYPGIMHTKNFNISVHHKPFMEVSGDYHNIISLGNNRYGIIIADVSGHGVSAALITMLIKDQFENFAPQYSDSKKLMEYIYGAFDNLMTDYDKFFTAFYMIVQEDGIVTFTNAGHPKSFVIRPGGTDYEILDTEGIFVGLPASLQQNVESKSIGLKPGDKVVLYTDGISESVNSKKEEYSAERLQDAALRNFQHSSDVMLENILKEFMSYSDPDKRKDDETLIIIEMIEKSEEGGTV